MSILKEEDSVSIFQEDLKSQQRTLREYLVGNERDLELVDRLRSGQYTKLNELLFIEEDDSRFIHNGLQLIQYKKVCREFGIDNWNKLSQEEQKLYKGKFRQKYTRTTPITARFKLTEQSLENLRKADVPDKTLEGLKSLENQEFTKESDFLNAVEKQIGNEQTVRYKELILKHAPTASFKIPYIEPRHISKFQMTLPIDILNQLCHPFSRIRAIEKGKVTQLIHYTYNCYLEEDIVSKYKNIFERTRGEANYIGEKILCPRIVGKELRAIYFPGKIYFSFDVYVLKLQDNELYHLILPILNSKLIDYYLLIKERKRIKGSYPKITMDGLKDIPIPKFLHNNPMHQIIVLSKELTAGKIKYENVKAELDEYIFDLYNLSIIERNRIKDFYIGEKERIDAQNIVEYCTVFYKVLKNFLQEGIELSFEFFIESALGIPFAGTKVSFSQLRTDIQITDPSIKQVVTYLFTEFIERMDNRNILSLKERIYSQDCIYIIKDTYRRSWSQTKALEDAQAEIERLCN